ncbi:MAG: peptidylprolyl isomerase, partial [Acidobacteria bacterium]|nr:peptidylprolyl isomerase [Acidobacteriota bacterium]
MKSGAFLRVQWGVWPGLLLLVWLVPTPVLAGQGGEPFVTPLSFEEMSGKQAVFETELGTIAIDLRPDLAPNHVGLIMQLAGEGHFDGTTFHRMVANGIVQGGDPLTADPERAAEYDQGGLGLVDAEFSDARHVRGAVSAVLVPGQPGSGGSQFFIRVVGHPGLA